MNSDTVMADLSSHTPMMQKYLYIDLYNNFLTKSTALQNIADIYRHKKLFDKALEFSQQALEIRESQKLLYEAEKSRIFIGKVYNA